jgi:hypothetical protein
MADKHVRFRELLPDNVLRRLDEQGSVPMFSPSVAGATDSYRHHQRAQQQHQQQEQQQQQQASRRFDDDSGCGDSNKENSPLPPSMALNATTPTPGKAKLRHPASAGMSPAAASTASSRETAFFTPVAKSVADLLDSNSSSNEEDEQHRLGDREVEASGRIPPTMDESLTPFSGITHSTMRPVDFIPSRPFADYDRSSATGSAVGATPRQHFRETKSAFTPASASGASSGKMGSPQEAWLASSPYKSLPRLDMLTKPYLSSCSDIPTLRRAIHVLESGGGERMYPQLLQVAKARLEALGGRGGGCSRTSHGNLPPAFVLPHRSPKVRQQLLVDVGGNQRPNDSLTLSTDTGDDELSSLQLLRESLERQPRYPYKRPSPLISQYSPSNVQQTSVMQQRLRQTEDKLQRTVQEVEGLQQLLQSTALQHDRSTVGLQDAIATLQSRLDQQRASNEKSQSEASTYRGRAQELTERLEQQKRDHDRVRASLEEKQRQMSEFLRASQRNADVVVAERTAMLKRMVQAMSSGGDGDVDGAHHQVEKLTKEERDAIVADFCAHLADSKSQLEELAAMVRETEKERRKILKAYKQVKEHYIETHNCMVGLERDNHILSNEIECLVQQLQEIQEHNADIESKQTKSCKRQQESDAVIRRLKEQIRTTEAMVPIGVYKSEVENAKREAAKADEYRTRVDALTKQVASLSARLTREGKAPPPPPPPSLSSARALQPKQLSSSAAAAAHRTPYRPHPSPKSVTPLENKPPLSINTAHTQDRVPPSAGAASRKAVSFALDPVEPPKSASKMAKVRAAGGRKALEEQLRKARSPRNQQQL